MKKTGKYLWNILIFSISIGCIVGIIYGVRELKLYLESSEEAVQEVTEDQDENTEENESIEEDESNYKEEDREIATVEDKEIVIEENNNSEDTSSPKKVLEMVFTGDVLFPDYFLKAYDEEGITGIISKEPLEVLKKADIAMINQEFPFSTIGEAMADKEYTFRIAPSRVEILNELGIDMVTLANNHTLDYGNDALLETILTLEEAEILYVGAGENLEKAKELKKIESNGLTIGFLGASRVIPVAGWNATENTPGMFTTYDPTALIEEITKAKETCDLVAVYVHWGTERNERPEAYQRELAMGYIDAGADMIIGSHPHVIQGIEYYEGKPIVYSLGNFIFNNTTRETGILKVIVDEKEELNLTLIPCTMKGSKLEFMEEAAGRKFFEYLTRISYDVTVDEEGRIINHTSP